jgi:hypothetical protein
MMSIVGSVLPVLGLSLVLATACDTTMEPSGKPAVEAVLDEPFMLAVGQTAVLTEEKLSVTFVRVLEDGRCPDGMLCIVASHATLAVQAQQEGKAGMVLNLKLPESLDAVGYEGFGIHVKLLMPNKIEDQTIRPEDYSARLLVDHP